MSDPVDDVTIDEQIAEVEREIKLRSNVYPRWIAANPAKLSPLVAKRQMHRIQAVLKTLQRMKAEQGAKVPR